MQQRNPIRLRIAPGPTGSFHVGRARTAVINWLFARHHGGTFVLRIEDTDVQRSKPEHLDSILGSLRWLGLDWDEGPHTGGPYEPYFQMGRLDTYQQAAQQLLTSGHAYECFCTPDELDALRQQAQAERRAFRYPGTCRRLTEAQRQEKRNQGIDPVLRLAVPEEGEISWDDLVLGEVRFQTADLDDFVIMRPNGIPLYNFAVAIDDISMNITYVIRGQDHVSNTPRQILVWQLLGKPLPHFGHVPLIVGEKGDKIGARLGAGPVTNYAEAGYLPEAVFNYLATLGASYGDEREIYSREELVERFDLGRIGKAPAEFSEEKLEWMNGVYIRALPLEEFVQRSLPFLQLRGLISATPSEQEIAYAREALALEQERVRTLAETPDAVDFFFNTNLDYDPALLVVKKSSPEDARRVVEAALAETDRLTSFDHDALEPSFRSLAERLGLSTSVVFGTIRVAVTGRTAAPPLFQTMGVLGRERVRRRLESARELLRSWGEGAA